MAEYGLSGSATYSVELSGLDSMMQVLPDNNYNQISARNLRDVVYTLWLNGGGGGSFSYTQGPPVEDKSTIGVGGIPANRNFVDVPLQTFLDEMLFPPLDNEYSISDQRVAKTSLSITLYGYIIPETINRDLATKGQRHFFSKSVISITAETVKNVSNPRAGEL